ncbi:MAG TPA: ABC transporter permease [Thermoanaerobaculia bacterium]|nr:ABC transporter permease [Thermoanaerobaculia bacterium]
MSLVVIAETLRRHLAHLGYIAALLMLIIIVVTMSAIGAPSQAPYEMISLFALIAGCQLIGPEFSSGTLQLILSKPIGRSTYLVSRVAGVALAIWVAIAVMFTSDVVGRLIADTPIVWRTAAAAALVSALKVLFVCSLMAFLGSFSRSYVNVGIYIGAQILMPMVFGLLSMMKNAVSGEMGAIGAFLRAHPSVIDAMGTVNKNLFPDAPFVPFDRNWIIMLLSNASVALLLACVIFSRREVPYGAD